MYIIIAKVLHGEASDAERHELDQWLQADQGHKQEFAEMKATWSDTDKLFETSRFDASGAWEKVAARMQEPERTIIPKHNKSIAFPAWAKYSSAIAAILLIALLVWHPFDNSTIRVLASAGNQRIELPDHSVITLRKGSSFSYPVKFAASERKVELQGEAFFEVAHNESQPFVIDAQSVSVRVLGTSFNVHCRPQFADVAVTTGRVQVSVQGDENKKTILLRGNTAHYESGSFTQGNASGYEALWKSDTLSFNSAPFLTVIHAIAAAKDTIIRLDAALSLQQQQQEITISFHHQTLEDMLTELCLITQCRWEKHDTYYIVKPKHS